MEKRKKIWASEEEREAWESHVDETLDRLWKLAERAQAELEGDRGREPRPQPRARRRQPRPGHSGRRAGRAFRTSEERAAWDTHVDETLARLRTLAERGLKEVEEKKRAADSSTEPS
jgi:hypothetical protein